MYQHDSTRKTVSTVPAGSVMRTAKPSRKNRHDQIHVHQAPAAIQTKLTVNHPGDSYEQEADRVADQVMRMSDAQIQRKCADCEKKEGGDGAGQLMRKELGEEEEEGQLMRKEAGPGLEEEEQVMRKEAGAKPEEEELMRKESGEEEKEIAGDVMRKESGSDSASSQAPTIVNDVIGSSGSPLDKDTRSFMEPRFGQDFSNVRVHTDAKAAESAHAVNARAYTVGSNVVFGAGQYQPSTSEGRSLMAHELTHVVQQGEASADTVQRDCDDPDFCKPYTNILEAELAEATAREVFVPMIRATFGSAVGNLWSMYLRRKDGDSLNPMIFDKPGEEIHDAFVNSPQIAEEQEIIRTRIANNLNSDEIPENTLVKESAEKFLQPPEKNLSTNFNDPLSIPGNIAGGLGESDAGPDYRKIVGGTVLLYKKNLLGRTVVAVSTSLRFEVGDAVDFCPGDCGGFFEKFMTIPFSRLEKSDRAFDVPFIVRFNAPYNTTIVDVNSKRSRDRFEFDRHRDDRRYDRDVRDIRERDRDDRDLKGREGEDRDIRGRLN